MAVQIQFRRDTSANWTSTNPILAEGELGLETDTLKYKIGDGVSDWTTLAYRELGGTFDTASFTVRTTDPSPPPDGTSYIYSKRIANRSIAKVIGASGLDYGLQPFLAQNKIGYWCPPGNAATVPGVLGYTAHTALGTATLRNVAATNMFTMTRRLGYVSAATAAALCGARVAVAQITMGNAGAFGGFFKVIRFGVSDAVVVTGSRMFIGISSNVAAPTNVEPSTLLNSIGVGKGAADTTLKIFYGGSSAQTPIDLGVNFPANTTNTDFYELALFCPPTSTDTVYYEVNRLNTGHTTSGTLTGTAGVVLPASSTLMTYLQAWRTNNATAAAVGLDIMSDYIETDN